MPSKAGRPEQPSVLKQPVHSALVLSLLDRLALVKLLLTAAYAYDQFGQTALVDEQLQRHNGISGLLRSRRSVWLLYEP